MVYCSKCGFENADDSRFCAKCGSPLYSGAIGSERRVEGFGPRNYDRNTCFGMRGGFWALLIGFAIVLWGISEIIRFYYRFEITWWPLIVIIIGIFIIVRNFHRQI